ncbi:MAG: hypothetical protein WCH58_02060 [Candidatus Saccharibacteria bacterium]
METHSYWHKQTADKPLYPDIEWSKPEQKSQAGRIGIIGGNSLGFAGVAEAYQTTLKTGTGAVRVLLPDALKKNIPSIMTEVIYGPTNPSGSLSREALIEMKAVGDWATSILLIGDAGRNSETAILYEDFIRDYSGPITITRDVIDLLKNSSSALVERPNTLIVASFAQLQKIFSAVYYPKVLTFSMQLANLVEALHKFTITYPVSIAVFHQDMILVASGGQVTTTPWDQPMRIWRGNTAANASVYWAWNPNKVLESVTASLVGR